MKNRFWAKVALPNEDGCMLWLKSTEGGYGRFWLKGRLVLAHRLSLIIATGADHLDLDAAHRCRNRNCVAPNHLHWATRKENVEDMKKDGTKLVGEKANNSKLTRNQVKEIRWQHATGTISQRALAEAFGTSQPQISKIVNSKQWKEEYFSRIQTL